MKYKCNSCGREWDYPIKTCIFCGKPVSKIDIIKYTVEGVTQVFVPSDDHPVAPYYVLLLKDSNGSYKFQKTFEHHDIGDVVYAKGKKEEECSIGVIGTGVTGKGIVEVAAKAGSKVIIKSRSEKSLKKAIEKISKNLSKGMEPEELEVALSRIVATTKYEDLSNADLVVESVIENLDVKRKIFQKLDSICNPNTILATNTSSLSISKIAENVKHPERVVGMHFFNPIPKMKLVEIIRTEKTSDEVLKKTYKFAMRFNKIPISVKDSPGFIVNRLLFIMINEACHMLDEGVASVEEIDKAMKLGANHPMGPFELADLIGLDLCVEIIENLSDLTGENKFTISNSLQKLVGQGHLGRKTGKGFYDYRK